MRIRIDGGFSTKSFKINDFVTASQPLLAEKREGYSGFTLVELLVVLAIIAILAAILLPVLSKAKARSRTTLCIGNFKSLSEK